MKAQVSVSSRVLDQYRPRLLSQTLHRQIGRSRRSGAHSWILLRSEVVRVRRRVMERRPGRISYVAAGCLPPIVLAAGGEDITRSSDVPRGERNLIRYAQLGEHLPQVGVHGVRRDVQPLATAFLRRAVADRRAGYGAIPCKLQAVTGQIPGQLGGVVYALQARAPEQPSTANDRRLQHRGSSIRGPCISVTTSK